MSGSPRALVPCCCSTDGYGTSRVCGCYLPHWPFTNGFTGWVPNWDAHLATGAQLLYPCPQHHHAASFIKERP